ncbi:TPA: DUF2971 domain-containing protein [Legionella pneumophila]|uniref:DUF2971 domain-containing protein n=1 Tax=Legionella pneumophila TaxID=446 RepID=UPI000770A0FF|nr:DUF2971 domain-containing protein [Legionella pneumophila]PQM70080.1 DUF2971 domain-containing protein [Legionella pneumophila]CZL45267.1 Protein of uncharacterised function (DUF2971) [Legionella pneumophila]HAU0301523.1 DUF2971 domain-containing protein [Legionella pneumophila]HCU6008004.1 DUF2971 domain-containing protein [Legionella pneumophila]
MHINIKISDLYKTSYVAHYTKALTAIKVILPHQTIKLGDALSVNDPYENKLSWFEDDCSTYAEDYVFDREEAKNILAQRIKLFCTTQCNMVSENEIFSYIHGLKNSYFSIPSMWAHYGDNHAGICLIFDKEILNEQIKKVSYDKFLSNEVAYQDYIPHRSAEVNRNNLKIYLENPKIFNDFCYPYIRDVFFKKNSCWSYEEEYRWLLLTENEDELLVNYQNSLKAIVLGADFDYENNFQSILDFKVPYYSIRFEYGKYILTGD